VTIPENSTGANVTVTPIAAGSTNILASASGFQPGTATVNVVKPTIVLTLNSAVGLTHTINGTVTLNAPAPAGGASIALSSNPVGGVTFNPVNVSIAAGGTTGTFQVTGGILGTSVITADSTGYISGTASVLVVNLGAISLPANLTVPPGQSAGLNVKLSSPAPSDGVTVALTSSDTNTLTVQPTVFIAAGATTAATQAQVTGIQFGSATVTASAGGYTGDTQTVKVSGTISFSPQVVSVGAAGDASVSLVLSAPAPAGGLPITLVSSDTTVATVPPSVTVAANSTTSPNVLVHGVAAGSATITASSTLSSLSNGTLPVTVTVAGSIALPANVSVGQGKSVAFPVTLSAPAPTGGTTVTLSTSDSTTVDISPKSLTIPAGQTQPASQPQLIGNGLGPVTITATAPGYGTTNQIVQGNTTLSFTPPTLTITGVQTQNLTLTLASPAPAGGLTVTLTSSATGVATVPATVSLSAGATSVQVPVTSVSSGTATITTSTALPAVVNATATITVQNAGAISVPANTTVAPGQSASFPVTISFPAPQGGVTISLVSSDTSKVTVPQSVTIAAGQTQPATQPQVTGVAVGSATITASSSGLTSGMGTVTVQTATTVSFSPPSLTISGTSTQNLTLTLSNPAPAGGLTFNVSSSNTSVATVGAPTATIAAGATTATVAVKGVVPGTAVIHASNSNFPDTIANVTVLSAVDIIVPATVSVAPGDSVVFPVSVAVAPQATLFLNLASSDPSKATVSPTSITIAAGQTQSSTAVRLIGSVAGTTTITVSAANGSLTPATSAVTVGFTLSITPANLSIVGNGNTGLVTFTLSGPAPAGGVDIALTSSNPSVATVISSVSISPSSTGVSARVTSVSAGTTVIHANAPGIPEATSTVTVLPPGAINISAPASIGLSQTGTLTVTLTTPAPGNGVSIDLVSSDSTRLAISPSTITIPAGATAPATQPQLNAVNVGPVTISASGQGYTSPAPVTVQVNATITWVSQNTTIVGIGTQALLQLRLNALAPLAGLTVNMTSSNTAVATVQAVSNFIWDGSTSPGILIPVTSVGAGTAIIHASGLNIPDVTTTVTVTGPLGITTPSLPNGVVGLAYSGPVAASGGVLPYVWTATGLPAGLSIDSASGTITGTPTAAGPATINVTVTDATSGTHLTASKSFPVTISPGITITTASLPNGFVGAAYSAPNSATGGTTPYVWTATGLPAGLSIDPASGAITGTPTTAGAATVNVTVTDATSPTHLTATKQFSVTIGGPFTVTTASLPNGLVGAAYSAPNTASGGTPPYTWTATGLPNGLSIDPASGAITGTPTTAGAATINVTATDSTSPTHLTNTKQFSVTIGTGVTITTASLPNGVVGSVYSGPNTASGGTPPYTWTATGLPAGLSIDPTSGTITGTPSAAGPATINVTATDATTPTHLSGSKQFSVTINAGITVTTVSLPNGVVGAAYSAQNTASGGTPPYAWTATGLPGGLSIDPSTGAISGTPNAAGPSTVTVTVTDATSPTHLSASKQFSVTIGTGLTITTALLPNGVVGSAYSATNTAAGGTAPYAWTATGLPAGLSIDPSSGAITGTPGAAGATTINVTVTDSTAGTHLTVIKGFPVTIAPALSLTTASLPNGVVGAAYSGPNTASGGTPPYAWTATGLPAGLSIDPATGAITGTPSTAGATTINVTVTDATSPAHQSVTKGFPVTISPGVTITTASLPNGLVNSAYSGTNTASGGTLPYVWTATGLPAGLSIDPASGAITGTPTTAGAATINVTVTDASSPTHLSSTKGFPITIVPVLSITTASLPNGVVNAVYSAPVAATGGTSPYAWTATGLPAGLSIDPASGAISGTPTTAGATTINVTVTDTTSPTHQSVTKGFPVTIVPVLSITTTSLPNGVVSSVYSGPMAAAGGALPLAWTATGLPAGLSIDPASGAITGTPTTAGAATINVTVTDATTPTHQSVTKGFPVTIAPVLSITTASLPNGVVSSVYSGPMAATGGNLPYAWTATGLPAGLSIDPASGAITGTPTTAGAATINVTVTDATTPTHVSVTKQFPVTIAPPVSITTASLPNGTVGTAYNSGALAAAGGTPAYTWSATGLPPGVNIDPTTGAITGTPSQAGPFTVTVTATDSTTPTHQTANKQYSITIAAGVLTITTSSLANGTVGAAYSAPVAASGGTSPLHWAATGLPNGLSINTTTGQITGTPTSGGTSSVNLFVNDSGSPVQNASKTLSLTIQALTITTSALPVGTAGNAYTFQLASAGGVAPLTWAVSSLPRGMQFDPSSGLISGTPSFPSSSTPAFTVTDSSTPPQSATKDLTLTIQPQPLVITTASPLPSGLVNTAYVAPALTATGGSPSYSWAAVNLPAGLQIDSVSGIISGTGTVVGTSNVTVTVTDSGSPTPQQVSKVFSLSITPPGGQGTIAVTNVAVGGNLQVPITITFTPALTIDATVTITSANPALLLLGSSVEDGLGALQAGLTAGTGSISTYVKALGSSGQVNITVSMPGYSNGTGTVTLANSGFVVAGTNGIGGAFNTFQGVSTNLTVSAARLDGSGLFVETEQVRGGITVNVPVISTVTSVGNVSAPAVTFSGGMDSTLPGTLQLAASQTTTGVTNVIVGPADPPFTQPAAGATLVVTVTPSGLVPFTATIGKNLQTNVSFSRTGSTTDSAVVTIQSLDATKLLFSTTPTGATHDSLALTIPANQSTSPDFYAHVYAGSGTVGYTLSSASYGSVSSTVTLAPSGLVILSPFGFGQSFTMTANSADATLAIWTAQLDSLGNPAAFQIVANGVSIPVTITADNSTVGNITSSPITISGGQANGTASTAFHALAQGTAHITASSAGYGGSTVGVTVTTQTLICTPGLTIGKFLQDTGSVIVPGGAPATGLHVTVQSNSPSLVLSTNSTTAGTGAISFDLTQGTGVTPNFFLQSQGSSGAPTYTVSAPGYNSATCSVALVPSGVVITNPSFGSSSTFSVGAGPQPLMVVAAQLDSFNNPATPQSLAGGASLVVSLSNTNNAAGTVPSTVTIAAGSDRKTFSFTPVAPGSTNVSVAQPAGWTLPTGLTSIAVTVVP
jgi:Putative Ig domain